MKRAFCAVGLACIAAASARAQDNPFVVSRVATVDGAPMRTVVSGDRRALPCIDALRFLADAMEWNLRPESDPLTNDLRFHTVDIDFVNQDPRMIAQLVAISAGADMVFDAGNREAALRPTLHVVRKPAGATPSGRNRLRTIASQWYRSFLVDDLRHEPVVVNESERVRMDLGRLLVENGDLESAIPFFAQIYEQRPGKHVPAAVLRLAQAQLDLAAGQRDPKLAREHYDKAEEWARKLLDSAPSSPEATGATVVLGRALLGQAE